MKQSIVRIILTVFFVICSLPNYAQEDSTYIRCKPTAPIMVSGVLIATGSVGVCNGWFHKMRNDVRGGFATMRVDKFPADDYLQYLPVTFNVTAGLLGGGKDQTPHARASGADVNK